MGDVLHALPAVTALRRAHPDWFIGWAIEPRWSGLLQSSSSAGGSGATRGPQMPVVDRWYDANTSVWKRSGLSGQTLEDVNRLRRRLRGERFDLCVDLQGSIRSGVIGRMSGARRFVGSAAPREGPARWLYTERVQVHRLHVIEQGCALLGAAVGLTLAPESVSLPQDEGAEAWCCRLLEGSGPIVLLAPTAGWGAKIWPAARYGAVARALGEAGYRVLVNAAGDGDVTALEVVEESGGAAEMVSCSVEQLIALMRRVALVVAGDTGPLHLAAALGRPVVGLYGPTDPARNGPYGTQARVLRHSDSRTSHARLIEAEAGLLRIGVDEVVSAAMEMLG